MAGIIEQDFKHWFKPVPLNDDYPDKFDLKCITSIEELNNILNSYRLENGKYPMMGFDTETTGLNPEENNIVGYSFSFDEIHGYYVPVNHTNIEEPEKDENGNIIKYPKIFISLGDEALDIIYNVMLNCEVVLMYNARFDIRMMKWYKFNEMTDEFKHDFIFNARMNFKYDMSKVNVYDIQVLVWASDTAHYMPKLKWAELQFLGWRSTTFEETNGDAGNFGYLDPEDPLVYKYAGTDSLALILLYNCDNLKSVRNEAGTSLLLHADVKLMPLTYFEETPILADIELLKRQSEYYHNKLDETEKRIYNIVGYEFNISSGPSRAKSFKDKNIIITETTGSGNTATGASVLEKIQKELDPESEQYILISLCIEYLHIKKMLSTYIDSLLEQVTNGSPAYKTGFFRYSYRNTATVSGRYAGGKF